jgi:serine/threonine-protein kinase
MENALARRLLAHTVHREYIERTELLPTIHRPISPPGATVGISNLFKSILSGGKVDVAARYQILREAVSGTMSNFHMARDRETDQIVGLKILDRKKTEALEARFKGLDKPTEGEIAASLNHPRIVNTFSHGITTNDEQFLVMEFLDGPGLNSLIIARSTLLDGNRLTLARQAAQALEAVHAAGYIHRDICPRNFVCAPDATSLKLIDFGLTVPAEKEFMLPGNRTGTPNYMAPEVVRRRPTDQRLDIYSYGASMYELFAFELPWQRGTDGRAAMGHGQHAMPPLRKYYPKIHPTLEAAIMKCIEPDPDHRFQSMAQFLQAIKRVKHEDAP